MSDKDVISDALEEFKLSDEAESENRINFADDVRFARLGEQWPEAVKKQRELDGRPCLTINRLPAMLRRVLNDARQNKPQIKVNPVGDDGDKATAAVLSGLIKNIEYTSQADVAYDTALDNAVTGGLGYFRITTDYANDDVFDQDICIERIIDPLSVYGDERSTAADSSDWTKAFITQLYKDSEFEKRWKGAEKSSWQDSYMDIPAGWRDQNTVRVAEYWTREEVPATLLKLNDGMVLFEPEYLKIKDILDMQGVTIAGTRPTKTWKVTQRIISGAEVLETNAFAGKYIPIVPVYGDEVFIDGKRSFISLTRWARDPQQMFNYWRSASTELVALAPKAPFIGPKGAFKTDANKWATANVTSHAYMEYDGQISPQRQAFAGVPAGVLQEALNASDDMKSTMGLFDAALGNRSNETSGRAIMQRQRESDTATFNYVDNLSRAIRHAGRIMVDLIPKVYNTERIIRVIHEDGQNESVKIGGGQPMQMKPDGRIAKMLEEAGQVTRVFDLSAGKYDVTSEAGPSYQTQRQEAAAQMVEMSRAFPPMMQVAGDILARNLDWPGADELAERLKATLPPHLQGKNPQLQQAQQQMQLMDQQAKQAVQVLQGQIQELQGKLEKESSAKAIEAMKMEIDRKNMEINAKEAEIKAYEAKTRRMQAMLPTKQVDAEIAASNAQEAVAVAAVTPKQRTMILKAPSGAIYEGVVIDQPMEAANG